MPIESQPILDYASPRSAKPRRLWLPFIFLSLASVVWYWPRLTPTFFPNGFDWTMLVIDVAAGAFLMARYSSLPGWVFVAYGAGATSLFLYANFNDNNFGSNNNAHDVLLPWCAMVAGGAIVSRVIGLAGRPTVR